MSTRDWGENNHFREGDLGLLKEVVYIRFKHLDQREYLFLLFESFRLELTYLNKGQGHFPTSSVVYFSKTNGESSKLKYTI